MTDHATTSPQILFVDDEAAAVKYFQRAIDSLAPVATAGSVEEGKSLLDEHASTLLVLVSDQRMPGGYGNELLHYAKSRYPHMVRILTTAYSELAHTVEAVNQGQIHRYIQKPWEIAALRMEMKQALELATLRREHEQLLREKMQVLQKQTVSNRIGTLYAVCAGLAGPVSPLESYLWAAGMAGCNPPEPDWQSMDYSDLVSLEAARSGQFAHSVGEKLAAIRERSAADWQPLLLQMLPRNAQASGNAVLVADGGIFSEFLQAPTAAPVSAQHASWLAYLLWLNAGGKSLQLSQTESAIECTLLAEVRPVSPERLAAWIERFCGM